MACRKNAFDARLDRAPRGEREHSAQKGTIYSPGRNHVKSDLSPRQGSSLWDPSQNGLLPLEPH